MRVLVDYIPIQYHSKILIVRSRVAFREISAYFIVSQFDLGVVGGGAPPNQIIG